jgi:hypothetical protein
LSIDSQVKTLDTARKKRTIKKERKKESVSPKQILKSRTGTGKQKSQ